MSPISEEYLITLSIKRPKALLGLFSAFKIPKSFVEVSMLVVSDL